MREAGRSWARLGEPPRASDALRPERERAGRWVGAAWTVLKSLEGSTRPADCPQTSQPSEESHFSQEHGHFSTKRLWVGGWGSGWESSLGPSAGSISELGGQGPDVLLFPGVGDCSQTVAFQSVAYGKGKDLELRWGQGPQAHCSASREVVTL